MDKKGDGEVQWTGAPVEARSGIEPLYAALQAAA
jgi:hypothetical protein